MATPARVESPKRNHTFRDFGGVNTQSARQAIKPEEFSWIENVMPIGHGNAAIVPAPSAALASIGGGVCSYMQYYNLNGVNYMFMASSNGSAYQVALDSPYTVTVIGSSFSGAGIEIAQWKNSIILIGDPILGYFTWDGYILAANYGVVQIKVTAGGVYTVVPSVSFTGGGVGAAASAHMTLDSTGTQTISGGGSGYSVGDILTIIGGIYSSVGKFHVDTVDGSGGVTAVSVFDGGNYTTLSTAPVSVLGGTGIGATITPAYSVLSVVITAPGAQYLTAPTVVFSSGAAAATAYILGGPSKVQHLATFSGRVWVSNGRTISWSAPDSYYDFSSTSAGSLIISDSTLISDITRLISANNFLYFTGVSSVNVIGDVSVNSSGVTVFSNTNLSASIGSDQPASISPYFRSVWMANRSGIYAIYGATPTKESDALDGIFGSVDFSQAASSGQMFLKNILCLAFLFKYQSTRNSSRALLGIFFNKKWFFASQRNDLKIIANGEQGGKQWLYGTDGTTLYKLFSQDGTPVAWKMQGAFWDMSEVTRDKQVTKFGAEFQISNNSGTATIEIDSLASTPPYSSSVSTQINVSGSINWINNSDNTVDWTNNALAIVSWLGSGYVLYMADGTQFGKYIGMTVSSSNITGSVNSAMLEYEYRGAW